MLTRLPDDFTAVVTGASGGIGCAVVEALLASDRPARVIAVSRHYQTHPDPRVESLALDLGTEDGNEALAQALNGAPVHLVFNAIGMLHDDARGIGPEKKLDELDAEAMARLYHVNAIIPALLLKALQPSLKGRHPTLFASLSARVGSIGDNRLGGWYAYRASKAAHNMLMKTAAVELRRLNPQAAIACLHPGTTDTPLSAPFQSRVPEGKLFTPSFVAESLLNVLETCTPDQSGIFLDWAGERVAW
ncbi:SDR family NAD(P)-dependent oxidoreductase [Halomonas saccharevitans]|uniref:NAD(P)-dependent dehydrogenase, short-chain alcohol dehydrogenase family n=1 Tax=Halomonas saccharevitans TaxID=416872 RepID=A0A1I6YT55_9GAMM|nr:SDR family NAD(P)-dependent oxidoreductase [Halomonas saccharevitans]MDT8878709.1 SDR family NAD(P)-dependent oxidoreductase [Halomonas saccharevitans]SFT53655.1 NAD(P)-dependent dehydrogenase, short-chain alcohol dehydrogenase family [Halomonas saccharevitans]